MPESHTSTQQWQSFEIRMRRRRAERCALKAVAALDAGFLGDAREALAEALVLAPDVPEVQAVVRRIAEAEAAGIKAGAGIKAEAGIKTESAGTKASGKEAEAAGINIKTGAAGVTEVHTDLRDGRPGRAWLVAAAAALVLVSAGGGWFWLRQVPVAERPVAVVSSTEFAPVREPEPAPSPEPENAVPPAADDTLPDAAPSSGGDAPVVARGGDAALEPDVSRPVADGGGQGPTLSRSGTAGGGGPANLRLPPAPEVTTPPEEGRLPEPKPAPPPPAEEDLTPLAVGSATVDPPIPAPADVSAGLRELPAAPVAPEPANAVVASPAPIPPVTADRPPAPSSGVTEERLVRAVLERYQAAYSSLDARAAGAVLPSIDRRALERAFDGLAAQQVTLGTCDVRITGASAQADCTGSAQWTPRVGGGTQTVARRWRFALRNNGGEWLIERAMVR